MRRVVLALTLVVGCAARAPAPPPPVPHAEPGRVSVVARAVAPAGPVQPIAVALTNGGPAPLGLEAQQIYALGEDDARVAPLPPADAARRAGGNRLPGAVKGGVVGAATGGVLGALGGAVAGAIQGGFGAAVAAGSAAGAVVGAVVGVLGGSDRAAPDVADFVDRALPSTTLERGFSATGYIYYPAGRYRTLEIVIPRDAAAERLLAPVEAAR